MARCDYGAQRGYLGSGSGGESGNPFRRDRQILVPILQDQLAAVAVFQAVSVRQISNLQIEKQWH